MRDVLNYLYCTTNFEAAMTNYTLTCGLLLPERELELITTRYSDRIIRRGCSLSLGGNGCSNFNQLQCQ